MEKALTRWEVCNSKPSLFQWEKNGERSSELINLAFLFTADGCCINPLSANPANWSNKLKQFVCKSRQIVLSVFDHFLGLALKVLKRMTDD